MIYRGDGSGVEVKKADNTWRGVSFLDIVPRREAPEGITERPFQCIRDGLTIRGYEFRPAGENLPIAIVCHGIMAWLDSVRHYAIELAILGYASYCFDFNGGSLANNISDGKTTDMSVKTEMADLESVIDYTRSLPFTDSNRIFLVGCSQGGFVSAMVASKNKYPIQKICLFYPALCIPSDSRSGKIMTKRFDPENIPDTIECGKMLLSKKYIEDAMSIDTYEEIGKYTGRVLIIHGTSDAIVNCAHSMRGIDAYLRTKPKGMTDDERARLVLISGGTHMFLKEHDLVALKHFDEFASLKEESSES